MTLYDKTSSIVSDVESKYKIDLRKRLFSFALESIKMLRQIENRKEFDVFKYQLSKSVTSIGANYEEAQGAYSKKEFASKIGICLKEARETNYFLRLIESLSISDNNIISRLTAESEEISKIFAVILIKIRKS
jgi:four helix bundle protein